ncbi:hybrid sensor histidine kinase/response regulator [Desulfobacter latus]|uniref:histidine kinase n=1 Tax=Desulfobacter latus TaxID=2292 RepID=A0A850SYR8_9BACT|nr:ATP-binding protein [Desulfobacter latus]NWH05280.1 PAS domain S-box protein [Desulfobacter latus]
MVNDKYKNDFWTQIPGLKFPGMRSYQVTVAVIFGLIGFFVNFLDIEFLKTGDFKISILPGVFFPLIIALAWGWRYGLLCALAGGCQTMWWLWYGDGWGIFYAVPIFTLWIVWHGWWADRRSDSSPWYMTSFAVEIPFRIVCELGFLMLFPWLLSLNPPPWDSLLLQDHVSSAWLRTVGIKHTVTAYLFLMVAYVLLSLGSVRHFFGLSSRRAQADTMVIYITAMLFGLVLWILDVLTNYFFFPNTGQTFWGLAVHGASPKELFFRSFYVIAALLVGIVLDRFNRNRVRLQERLDHQNRVLAAIRNVNQLIVGEKDSDRLLNKACALLVETRGFYNAWIALTVDGRPKEPFYHVGFNGEFIPMAERLLAGDIPACAKAVHRSGNVQVKENPLHHCKGCPLSDSYIVRAGLCVGLNYADRNFGWLSLSCPSEFAHDAEEHDLIKEVAGDIAFALWSIENDNQRKTVERRYADVLAVSVDAVVATDMDDRITVFNPSAEKMFNCQAQEALGSPITRFCPEDCLAEREQMMRRLHETGEVASYESERLTADGQRIWVEFSKSISRDDLGHPQGINSILRDISERKKMEQEAFRLQKQMQQAQKMESIGSLAGGIAHDFNNILFPIVGFSQMLMEDFSEDSTAYQHAREILTAAGRATELVKQILSFSRQSEDKNIPVRFQSIVKEVLKLCRSTIPSNITIHQEINSQCGYITANPTQLHQILMNLMTNAYHAIAPDHGEISLRLCEKEFCREDIPAFSLEPGRYVMLSVSDTGEGIAPDIIDKIFDPYFTTKEKGKGTGLGLSVVHGIINTYGGEIKVYSEIGQGTTFNVYLPLKEKAVEPPTAQKTKINPTGTEHILLVDDEKPIVQMEKTIIERLGYQVTSRTGSIEALELFKAKDGAFDLVITDMTMPNMTGDQLAKELLAVNPDIPIIIVTGFSERINKDTIETLGIKGVLMKPVVISDMALEIRRVLDERQGIA